MKTQWIHIYHMISTFLLLLWKLGAALQHDYDEVLYTSACFHEVKKSLTLNCSRGHMVKLNRIFYAYTEESNTCSYGSGHCTMDLPDFESYSCIGKTECTINLPSGDMGKYIPKCGHYGTYAQAEFQCIPDTETTDICNKDIRILTSARGFISTPNYPYNYPNHQNCTLTLEAPFSDQQIILYTIDLTLEENGTDCVDLLHIFDGHRAATYCAARVRSKEMTTIERWLKLDFYSSAENTRKGFWLYYEATPYREWTSSAGPDTPPTHWSYLTSASESEHLNPGGNQTTTGANTLHITQTEGTTIVYTGNVLTLGAIIGVVVSLLLLLTVIILVILVCKRKDSPGTTVKVPSSVSCNSEAAFLNFGPNCYAQSGDAPPTTTVPPYVEHNNQAMNNRQPVHHAMGNPDFEAGVTKAMTPADVKMVAGMKDYKLDTEYYKKSGCYLEEVI